MNKNNFRISLNLLIVFLFILNFTFPLSVFAANLRKEEDKTSNKPIPNINLDNSPSEADGAKIVEVARKWVKERGVNSSNPIKYDMSGPRDMETSGDCSTFTKVVYREAGINKNIGGFTAPQFKNKQGTYVKDLKDLEVGNLIFFKSLTSKSSYHKVTVPDLGTLYLQHVGIVTKNENGVITMAHFSSSGLKEELMGKPGSYWAKRYIGGKKFVAGGKPSLDDGNELNGKQGLVSGETSIFMKGILNVKNSGIDNKETKEGKQNAYLVNTVGSKFSLFLFRTAQFLSILFLGYLLLLWLIYFLAYCGMDMFIDLLSNVTFNKINFGDNKGLMKLGIFSAFSLLVIVLVLFGLIPKIFAFIYHLISLFFKFLGRVPFYF